MLENGAAFWNRVAQRYEAMAIRNPVAFETTLNRIRTRLKPEDRVLEVGCGTGTTALKLAGAVRHYIGTDYATDMIAIATEKRSQAKAENLEFRVGQVCDGSLPDGPFDVILGFNILHLLPDRRAAFAEIARKLRSDGLFVSKTPCLGGIYRVLQPLVAVLRLMGKAPDFKFVTPARLEREIRQAGFEVVEVADYPKRPPRRFIVAKKL